MTLFDQPDSGDALGNTPLSCEEQADLIPNLATREELNEWERQNILEAHVWALDARNIGRQDPLAEAYVRELHRRWRSGDLESAPLAPEWKARVSRRARVQELADLLETLT